MIFICSYYIMPTFTAGEVLVILLAFSLLIYELYTINKNKYKYLAINEKNKK